MAAHGDGSKIDMLQEGISARQAELKNVAHILAVAARNLRRYSGWIRVMLIILGALAATQGAWDTTFGEMSKAYVSLTFTVLGILIATLAGIEAAFKFEAKGAELNLLAASCHSTVRKTDASWYRLVGIAATPEEQITGAMALIELQDTKLSEIQEKAATSGVNITLEIRGMYGVGENLYREDPPTGNGPYQA